MHVTVRMWIYWNVRSAASERDLRICSPLNWHEWMFSFCFCMPVIRLRSFFNLWIKWNHFSVHLLRASIFVIRLCAASEQYHAGTRLITLQTVQWSIFRWRIDITLIDRCLFWMQPMAVCRIISIDFNCLPLFLRHLSSFGATVILFRNLKNRMWSIIENGKLHFWISSAAVIVSSVRYSFPSIQTIFKNMYMRFYS